MKRDRFLFMLFVICSFSLLAQKGLTKNSFSQKIKVACVGNSITYGAGIVNREKNSYPAQLQVYLGDKYEVRNFGRNGATALHKGDYPYVKTDVYEEALAYCPDIVFIKLGTNDSKPQNIRFLQDFKSDYRAIIQRFRTLPSHPRIILLSPIRCFLPKAEAIKDSVIRASLVPVIKEIAQKEQLEYVELYDLMGAECDESLMPDRLHPSSIGAGRIAQKLYEYLKPEEYDPNPCTHPICGNEYRSGAGWKEGADWHAVSEEITQIVSSEKLDILFLGNSITQGFGGSRQLVTYKPGKAAADSCFKDMRWESAGISGDRTETLLWRVMHGDYGKSNPSYVVITIGVNNIVAGHQSGNIAEGIRKVAFESKKQFPDAKIVLLGLLPVGLEKDSDRRKQYDAIHELLKQQDWGTINYVNPTSWFTYKDGRLKEGLYGGDHLHLTSKGYEVWCRHLKDIIDYLKI